MWNGPDGKVFFAEDEGRRMVVRRSPLLVQRAESGRRRSRSALFRRPSTVFARRSCRFSGLGAVNDLSNTCAQLFEWNACNVQRDLYGSGVTASPDSAIISCWIDGAILAADYPTGFRHSPKFELILNLR